MPAATEMPATADQPVETPATEPASIDVLRRQIDAVDAALTRLLAERAQLSGRIQAARMSDGGPRVVLGRERAVHAAYRRTLGAAGGAVADAVLRYCRGNR